MTPPSPDDRPGTARPQLTIREEGQGPPADTELTRRTALKFLSATSLLAMGAGCTRKPMRHIVARSDMPEYERPGRSLEYATTYTDGLWPYGMMVEAMDGRPVKVEGLPTHPLSRGKSTSSMQASTWTLYDPDRLAAPERQGKRVEWKAADQEVVKALREASSVLLVTRSTLGPTEQDLVKRFLSSVRGGQHVVWESIHDGPRRSTWKALYGRDGVWVPDFEEAAVVLSIDSDFLGSDGDFLSNTRGFAARRRVLDDPKAERLSRLWVAESGMTITGSNADHRIPMRPGLALGLAQALTKAVGGDTGAAATWAKTSGLDERVLLALAEDLHDHARRGDAVVLAGPHLPPAVHAAVALLNDALGAPGKTLRFETAPPQLPSADAAALASAFDAAPDVAILLGVNPVYDAPGTGFEAHLAKAKLTVAHGLTKDETLSAATFALPSAHNLESWNDRAPGAGLHSICQPLIAPLFEGRQEADSLLAWTRALRPDDPAVKDAQDFHDLVRERWEREVIGAGGGAVRTWNDALRVGWVGEAVRAAPPSLSRARAEETIRQAPAAPSEGFDLVLQPHHTVHDGRFASAPWLLELPEPATKVVWDNYAALAPSTAARLGLTKGAWVRVAVNDAHVDLPAIAVPGTAPDTVVVSMGLGRRVGAGLGNGAGFDVTPLAGLGPTPWIAHGAKLSPQGGDPYLLSRTQKAFEQEHREIVIDGTKADLERNPEFVKEGRERPSLAEMYTSPYDYEKGHKWIMAIDLATCIGCGVCAVACEVENNVAFVGKDEVERNREMMWLRIDRYEAGDPANPKVSHQPMLCQQCDNAPCENVCPVNASVHGPEGLNEQVYNRCVGTRYCENNCPFKVRRFNFYNFTKRNLEAPVQELRYNPQVTVRSRGVMEKCTFCIQRINAVKFVAENAGTPIPDGSIQTACQQACPTRSIFFGDRNDKASVVHRLESSPLGYRVLEELNVRPNVTYLARVRNPHPRLAESGTSEAHQ